MEFPNQSERENVAAVKEGVTREHEQGLIIVGDAKVVDEFCLIKSWPEPAAAMELETAEAEKLRFCFWIQWKIRADR